MDNTTGLLKTTHGVSLNKDAAKLERFGGAYKVESLPEGLKIEQRGNDPMHYEIMPAVPMTFEKFGDLLKRVTLRRVG